MTLMLSSSLPCPAAWGSAIAMVLGLHSRPNAHTEDLRLLKNVNISLDLLSAKRCHACLQGWRARPSKVWSPYRPARFSTHSKRTPFGLKNTKRSTLAVSTKGTLVQGGGWVSKWGRGSEA